MDEELVHEVSFCLFRSVVVLSTCLLPTVHWGAAMEMEVFEKILVVRHTPVFSPLPSTTFSLFLFRNFNIIIITTVIYSWEFTWRPTVLFDWMHENNWFPIACVLIYLVGIVAGPIYMEKREPYVMKKTMAAWNLLLAAFSAIGVLRLLPQLIHNIYTYGFTNYLCMDPENSIGASATGMWCLFFVLSKPAYVSSNLSSFFIPTANKAVCFCVVLISSHSPLSQTTTFANTQQKKRQPQLDLFP